MAAKALTAADLYLVRAARTKWTAIGLSAGPTDTGAAEAAVKRLYDAQGFPQSPVTIWMGSPAGCLYAANAMALRPLHHEFLWRVEQALGNQLATRLGEPQWHSLRDELMRQFRVMLEVRLRSRLGQRLHDVLNAERRLERQEANQLWNEFSGQLPPQHGVHRRLLRHQDAHLLLSYSVFPWHDARRLALYQVALQIAGMEPDPRLDALADVVAQVGWFIPLRGAAILGSRPTDLNRDARGELHNPAGMALAYPDGWGLWCWHGRPVPQWVITQPSVRRIAREPNAEIRRCAIESLGWDRFIAEARLRPVGREAPDPGNPGGTLRLYDIPPRLWGSPARLLTCANGTPERDGTRRRYGLTVPADITDPLQAAAWTYGMTSTEYVTVLRRT